MDYYTNTDTSTLTGRVGIGKAPHTTYALDVNGTINATSVLVGGATIGGSKWTTTPSTTNIYYSSGNVGIGHTAPIAPLCVGNSSVSGSDGFILIGKNNGGGGARHQRIGYNANFDLVIGDSGAGSLGAWTEAFKLSYASPANSLVVDRNGNVSTAGVLNVGTLNNYVGGNINRMNVYGGGDYISSFKHPNDSQGIGITYDGFTALGSSTNANQNIVIRPKGTGTFQVIGNTTTTGFISVSQYILSNSDVISRSSFDTRIISNGGGMFLKMSTIGSDNDYLEISAAGNATNINSGQSRPIWMRIGSVTWLYVSNGGSYNGLNSSTWQIASDHRIKENIKKANLKTCYDNVKNINLYRFNYIDGFKEGAMRDKTRLGHIAQQVKQHFPKSVSTDKHRLKDKREIPDLASIDVEQINMSLFGAVKQLIKIVEKQNKHIKKLEEMLNIIDDDEVDNDADEPYERIVCDEVDIDTIEPSEPPQDVAPEPPADIPKETPQDIPMPMGI